MTVREKLVEMFGPSAPERVVSAKGTLSLNVESAHLVSTEGTGALQVTCGGDVLICFVLETHQVSKLRVYLVRDDSVGQSWDAQARQGVPFHKRTPTCWRPHAVLRLAESA